jgi:ribose transport system permease protein
VNDSASAPDKGSETLVVADGPAAAVQATVPPAGRRFDWSPLGLAERYGVIVLWGVIIVVFSALRPDTFATKANWETIFGTQSVQLVITLGLLIPLTANEFDLSVASVMGFSATLVGWLNVNHHVGIVATIIATLVAGSVIGSANAFLVVRVGVPSLIATLGMGTLLSGAGFGISNSVTIGGISSHLTDAAQHELFGLPMVFYLGVVICIVLWYVFDYTPAGRHLLFVGAGRDVARLSGLRVDRMRAISLILCSTIAALAGIMQAGVVGAADPGGGASFLLPAFAGAFLGQTVIRPGRFNPWGTFVAVYFLVTGITGLELLGAQGWVQDVFYGASLIIAVSVAHIVARRSAT